LEEIDADLEKVTKEIMALLNVQVTNEGNDVEKIEKLNQYEGRKVYISSRNNLASTPCFIQFINTSVIFDWLRTKEDFIRNIIT